MEFRLCSRGGTGFALTFGKSQFASGFLIYGVLQDSSFCFFGQFASRGVPSSGEPAMAQLGGSCMLSKRVVLVVVALCCLFALTPSTLYSQSASAGSVAGLVTDTSGASVVGATITLIDKATNTPRTVASNEAGRYNFANVAPGDYALTANKA